MHGNMRCRPISTINHYSIRHIYKSSLLKILFAININELSKGLSHRLQLASNNASKISSTASIDWESEYRGIVQIN